MVAESQHFLHAFVVVFLILLPGGLVLLFEGLLLLSSYISFWSSSHCVGDSMSVYLGSLEPSIAFLWMPRTLTTPRLFPITVVAVVVVVAVAVVAVVAVVVVPVLVLVAVAVSTVVLGLVLVLLW